MRKFPQEPVPDGMITVVEFANLAGVSRRTIDRFRRIRPSGFPTEYDLAQGRVSRPRFKTADVLRWIDTRALW